METQYKFVGTFNKLLKRRGEDHFKFMKITSGIFVLLLYYYFCLLRIKSMLAFYESDLYNIKVKFHISKLLNHTL